MIEAWSRDQEVYIYVLGVSDVCETSTVLEVWC